MTAHAWILSLFYKLELSLKLKILILKARSQKDFYIFKTFCLGNFSKPEVFCVQQTQRSLYIQTKTIQTWFTLYQL